MRCLQIALKALSISNSSLYAQNEGPDTSMWMLILGGIRCAALHLAVWLPISRGLIACHVPVCSVGASAASRPDLLQPSAHGRYCFADGTLLLGKKMSDG